MIKVYRLVLALAIVELLLSNAPIPENKVLQKGYYIVVAAYFSNQENYAMHYSEKLNKIGLHSNYGFDEKRKFFYVYLDQYSSFETSVKDMLKIREDAKFEGAWVRIIKEKEGQEATASAEIPAKKEEPKVAAPPTPVASNPTPVTPAPSVPAKKEVAPPVVVQNTIVAEPKKEEAPPAPPVTETVPTEKVTTEVVPNPKPLPVYEPQNLRNTPVFLSLFNATTNEVLDGEVEIVDAISAKLIRRVKGNDYLSLPNPNNKTGELLLITNVFGFRKEEHSLNYKNTEADTLKPYVILVGNYYMVNFPLSKIHKGDISTLYNVYFYNDAAIMLPTSQYQLNSLLNLMKENPTYKIILHGHTNGGGRGKIIYMGESQNFFTITKDSKEGAGSAKELSEARAEVIKKWLVAQGIAESRMDVRGWGGSRMIHDKNSSHARKNIRVDVEVSDE